MFTYWKRYVKRMSSHQDGPDTSNIFYTTSTRESLNQPRVMRGAGKGGGGGGGGTLISLLDHPTAGGVETVNEERPSPSTGLHLCSSEWRNHQLWQSSEEDAGKRGFGGRCRKARLWRKVPESEALEEGVGKRGFGRSAGNDTLDEGAGKRSFGGSAGKMKEDAGKLGLDCRGKTGTTKC